MLNLVSIIQFMIFYDYRLYFNATNFRKFFDVIRPYLQYIPKEFYYKFNMQYIPNRIRDSLEFSEKYNGKQVVITEDDKNTISYELNDAIRLPCKSLILIWIVFLNPLFTAC